MTELTDKVDRALARFDRVTAQLDSRSGLVRDARFLMDSAYQAPRSIRLGLKVGF